MFLAAVRIGFLYGVQDPGSHRLLCHRNARIRIMALSVSVSVGVCVCVQVWVCVSVKGEWGDGRRDGSEV